MLNFKLQKDKVALLEKLVQLKESWSSGLSVVEELEGPHKDSGPERESRISKGKSCIPVTC
jgi:hypothetical protein